MMTLRAATATLFFAITWVSQTAVAQNIDGTVMLNGQPVPDVAVTLWGTAARRRRRSWRLRAAVPTARFQSPTRRLPRDSVLYVVARDDAKQLALLSVLGTNPPGNVVVNELTTVASAFTSARFINGESISGNPLGLRIAAGNAPNLVDPVTGTWGEVLLDPLNSTENTTLAKLNTLGSLIVAFATVADDEWRTSFFKAATPTAGATPKTTP